MGDVAKLENVRKTSGRTWISYFEKRLSPLLYQQINVLGHYSFTLSEQIKKGKLRSLNLAEIP